MRCLHESTLHEDNVFITLTYDDKFLPPHGSLRKRDFQLFMKRLRKEYGHVRFYHCGEYGGIFGRPHYHACLFGVDFPDKRFLSERPGGRVYRSASLERLWPFGLSEIGSVTFESAAYVARYIMKKALGASAESAYDVIDPSTGEVIARREPEYTTMSRRPGIGYGWYQKFGAEVYEHDSVVVRGQEMKPARYYDKLKEMEDPAFWDRLRRARQRGFDEAENTWERLEVREKVAQARVNLYSGGVS